MWTLVQRFEFQKPGGYLAVYAATLPHMQITCGRHFASTCGMITKLKVNKNKSAAFGAFGAVSSSQSAAVCELFWQFGKTNFDANFSHPPQGKQLTVLETVIAFIAVYCSPETVSLFWQFGKTNFVQIFRQPNLARNTHLRLIFWLGLTCKKVAQRKKDKLKITMEQVSKQELRKRLDDEQSNSLAKMLAPSHYSNIV